MGIARPIILNSEQKQASEQCKEIAAELNITAQKVARCGSVIWIAE